MWTLNLTRSLLVATVLCLSFAAPTVQAQGDPVTGFSTGDPAMNAAQDDARATLPLFFENALDGAGNSVPGASLKVAFDTANGAEVIWVSPFQIGRDGMARGLLSNQPNFMDGLSIGDLVEFDDNMIRDWAVRRSDGFLWGPYTTRVIVTTFARSAGGSAARAAFEPSRAPGVGLIPDRRFARLMAKRARHPNIWDKIPGLTAVFPREQ